MKSMITVCFLFPLACIAQKEANVWITGDDYVIDFNYERFSVFDRPAFSDTDDTYYFGTSASVCDPETGSLLFYTNGRLVWNRDFRVMPGGQGLHGGRGFGQTALIVPYPDTENLYYLFTARSMEDSIQSTSNTATESATTGLRYSIIDMFLDRGKGDVIPTEKNKLLLDKSTETLTAVPHENGRDFWLLTHEWGSNRFIVYPVTPLGIGNPVYYSLGQAHNPNEPSVGCLRASPDGKMLAFLMGTRETIPSNGIQSGSTLEWYDFDASNSAISNRRILGVYKNPVSAIFSPDNTKLYFTSFGGDAAINDSIYQFDLKQETLAEIIESRKAFQWIWRPYPDHPEITVPIPHCNLQLAPDGKLYNSCMGVSDNSSGDRQRMIFYLDKPNEVGLLSGLSHRFLESPNNTNFWGNNTGYSFEQTFPNFMQHYFNGLESIDNSITPGECAQVGLTLYLNPTNHSISISSSIEKCLFPIQITIYNTLGQVLNNFRFESGPVPEIDMSSYSPGMYLMIVRTFNRSEVKKVIKL